MRSSIGTVAIVAALVLALGACTEERVSQLVVAVDSDMRVPDEIDEIRIDVVAPDGRRIGANASLVGPDALPLPRTVTLVQRDGALGPVDVTAVALKGGENVVERRAVVRLEPGKTMLLVLELVRECIGRICGAGETCARGGCREVEIARSELVAWPGSVPRADAGEPADAGTDAGCIAQGETCNGADDDCDGTADEGFDLATDPRNCGACGRACSDAAPHVMSAACAGGSCAIECVDGWFDCNGVAEDGCESRLRELESCGACGQPCALARGASSCETGVCELVSCDPGFEDCDSTDATGCESSLDELENCGACGVECVLAHASESCGGGVCDIVSCEAGWDNCDSRRENGCEVELATDEQNCGRCGNACPANPPNGSSVCTTGACRLACDPGWADCDGILSNGCEANLASAATCGACTVSCRSPRPICVSSAAAGYTCETDCVATLCGDSCVDPRTDPRNCGACGVSCPAPPHASPTCASGRCGFACDIGFGDCDGIASNGCESPLDTLANCGACGSACVAPGGTASCAAGRCELVACDPGRGDCDGRVSTGCETSLETLTSCGGCGVACARDHASETCAGGVCRIAACEAGWGSCDAIDANGCETPLDSLTHCGACGNTCIAAHTTASCAAGMCVISACESGWSDCNGLASDGCESSLTTVANCGACGVRCAPANATASCATGACAIVTCDPGWRDCNTTLSDGCEVNVDTDETSCGACGVACDPIDTCVGGACQLVCPGTLRDCNGDPIDACETNILTSKQNCGACGTRCEGPDMCCNGTCARSCG